ncbi:hypothetical protein THAOC_25909, partial [Thalassiosira oceanica]
MAASEYNISIIHVKPAIQGPGYLYSMCRTEVSLSLCNWGRQGPLGAGSIGGSVKRRPQRISESLTANSALEYTLCLATSMAHLWPVLAMVRRLFAFQSRGTLSITVPRLMAV